MTRPLRLMMTVDAVGGVWQYAMELCAALHPLGVEIVLACLGPSPDKVQRAAAAMLPGVTFLDTGLDLDWLAPDPTVLDAVSVALAKLAQHETVDILHCNQPALATEDFTMPVVATIHSCVATWWNAVRAGPLPEAFRWQTERVARGLRCADAVVAPSRAFAENVSSSYELHSSPEVVANGRSPPVKRGASRAAGAFTAGRLWDEGKGIAFLETLAPRLSRPIRAAGPTRGPNGQNVDLRHIEAVGPLDDRTLAAHLAGRPVFVSAARYEPFGLAVLEAAQAACPLVLSDIPTFREIWGHAACFVPPGDESGFVEAIEALFANPPARVDWGRRARERAAFYTPERTAAGMMTIYERVLSRASTGRRDAA